MILMTTRQNSNIVFAKIQLKTKLYSFAKTLVIQRIKYTIERNLRLRDLTHLLYAAHPLPHLQE
jgi:hypothetical protein